MVDSRQLQLPLRSERLLLRDMRPDDLPGVLRYAADPEVARFQPWDPADESGHRAYLAATIAQSTSVPRSSYQLAIERVSDQRFIGVCDLTLSAPWEATLGYFLEAASWGRGYATEAVHTLIEAGFSALGLHRISATCAPENHPSVRVLEKLGMRREGHLRQHFRLRNGWRDSYLYAVLTDEWHPH